MLLNRRLELSKLQISGVCLTIFSHCILFLFCFIFFYIYFFIYFCFDWQVGHPNKAADGPDPSTRRRSGGVEALRGGPADRGGSGEGR